MNGVDYVIPFLTYERDLTENRVGVIVNSGFLPQSISDNPDLATVYQNSLQEFEIEGVVTKNKDLDKGFFGKDGNVNDEQRFDINTLNLRDIANFSGFRNKDNMKTALIERIDPEFTGLDRADPHHYAIDLNGTKTFPIPKVFILI